jgi:hypothetical protein
VIRLPDWDSDDWDAFWTSTIAGLVVGLLSMAVLLYLTRGRLLRSVRS